MEKVKGLKELFIVFKSHLDVIAGEMKLPLVSDEDARQLIALAKKQGCSDECLLNLGFLRSIFLEGYSKFLCGDIREAVL